MRWAYALPLPTVATGDGVIVFSSGPDGSEIFSCSAPPELLSCNRVDRDFMPPAPPEEAGAAAKEEYEDENGRPVAEAFIESAAVSVADDRDDVIDTLSSFLPPLLTALVRPLPPLLRGLSVADEVRGLPEERADRFPALCRSYPSNARPVCLLVVSVAIGADDLIVVFVEEEEKEEDAEA
jgi:hypothetical protein